MRDKPKDSRDVRKDPQPGDIIHRREGPSRCVTGRFIDATDEPYVIFTVEHRVSVRSWRKWCHRMGVGKWA